MMNFDKKIAVVILNYNNWKDTIACVESVLASTYAPEWIFVVDNKSSDGSMQKLQQWATGELCVQTSEADCKTSKSVQYIDNVDCYADAINSQLFFIQSADNKGYAAGNNHGIRRALQCGADAVWILNNDTVVEKEALGAMQARLFSKMRPGLCGSLVCYFDSGLVQCCGGGMTNVWTGLSRLYGHLKTRADIQNIPSDEVEKNIKFIYGASVMASREFIETVGLMDERYFLYSEEQDWVYSAKGRFDLAYAHDAVVLHKEGGTTGFSGKKMALRSLWYLTRSRILLTCKHKPWALPTVCAGICFAIFRMILRRVFIKKT